MNPFDETITAVRAARTQLQAADDVATSMADLLRGRLRHVHRKELLAQLKSELRDYNSNTNKWRDK